MRRMVITLALSLAILAAGALVPVQGPFDASAPRQTVDFVRLV
jgi:hypothetical protein